MSFRDYFKVVEGVNKWLQVQFVPEIGGRIMQISLDGYSFLFNNPSNIITENYREKASAGQWINYGGEKLWPAPQGWGKKTLWPGPPDVVLDGGVFALEKNGNEFYLESEVDPYTGLQVSRTVSINDSNTIIQVDCVFENKSGEVKEWAIWPVAQLHAENFENNSYELILPLAEKSSYATGFYVMHGLVNNPQIRIENKQLKLNFQYLIGKIAADSDQGWVAYLNKENGKVYVNFFETELGQPYPDNSTVQIWTQGRGMIYSRNIIKEFPNNIHQNPPYLEIELLSPLKPIQPQQKATFSYQIGVSTIALGDTIQQVNRDRITCVPLTVLGEGGFVVVTASYGFFEEKAMELNIEDTKSGKQHYREEFKADPNHPLKIELKIDIGTFHVDELSVTLTETKESNKRAD
ncbi:MAG: DUF4380 domain-containing protein [Pedobacter sp.]|uniref:DUF4380 domain-containing protein n=1 Tax=Pedobacter sp. TaxID=1411316 RepID=UPI00280A4CFD|nr:DUF4380 domain-containing protein [Pedobacter sp.]MDQ8004170.1 DUF4380 domain-containing protein [Pedobacter sp.]